MDNISTFLNSYKIPNFFRDVLQFSGGFAFLSFFSILYSLNYYNKISIYPVTFLNVALAVIFSYFIGRLLNKIGTSIFTLIQFTFKILLEGNTVLSKWDIKSFHENLCQFLYKYRRNTTLESIDHKITAIEIDLFAQTHKRIDDAFERLNYSNLIYSQLFAFSIIIFIANIVHPLPYFENIKHIKSILLVVVILFFIEMLHLDKSFKKKRKGISRLVADNRKSGVKLFSQK